MRKMLIKICSIRQSLLIPKGANREQHKWTKMALGLLAFRVNGTKPKIALVAIAPQIVIIILLHNTVIVFSKCPRHTVFPASCVV